MKNTVPVESTVPLHNPAALTARQARLRGGPSISSGRRPMNEPKANESGLADARSVASGEREAIH